MRCGIALGSNLGDRAANLREGLEALRKLSADGEVLASRFYETEPVDCEPDAPGFLNAAGEIEYASAPSDLLAGLQAVEVEMGRPSKHPRNAPRLLDLDILYFGELVLENGNLIVPHPRLAERRFVLAPLADIRPELILPGMSDPVKTLLANLPDMPQVNPWSETP